MAEAIEIVDTLAVCQEKGEHMECAVCLQKCIHPAQLPCGHIFCFLCVKGFANQNKRCAMCRQEIPRDFIEQPNLIEPVTEKTETFDNGFQWFYEGRNGWWRYDERANEEIEQNFQLGIPNFDLMICGETYVIDFKDNFQYPKKNSTKKRAIKRDRVTNVVVKGVAGLRQ